MQLCEYQLQQLNLCIEQEHYQQSLTTLKIDESKNMKFAENDFSSEKETKVFKAKAASEAPAHTGSSRMQTAASSSNAIKLGNYGCKADVERSASLSSCFGQPPYSNFVFTSLSGAVDVWEAAGEARIRNALPKVNIVASVVEWGVPKQTKGRITFNQIVLTR